MAVNGRTGIFPHRIDRTTDANTSIDYAHKEVHSGDAFYVTQLWTLDVGDIASHRFKVPNTLKWPHFYWAIESQGQILIEIRENITDELENVGIFNHNRNYADNLTTVRHDPQVSAATAGTVIYSWASGGAAATPSRGSSPAIVRGDEELVLKTNTTYEWRITSNVDDNKVSAYFTWYEHTNIE